MESQDYLQRQAEQLGKVLKALIGRFLSLNIKEIEAQIQIAGNEGKLPDYLDQLESDNDEALIELIETNAWSSEAYTALLEYFLLLAEKYQETNHTISQKYCRKVHLLTPVAALTFENMIRVQKINDAK